jgi:hypothetical protein
MRLRETFFHRDIRYLNACEALRSIVRLLMQGKLRTANPADSLPDSRIIPAKPLRIAPNPSGAMLEAI